MTTKRNVLLEQVIDLHGEERFYHYIPQHFYPELVELDAHELKDILCKWFGVTITDTWTTDEEWLSLYREWIVDRLGEDDDVH